MSVKGRPLIMSGDSRGIDLAIAKKVAADFTRYNQPDHDGPLAADFFMSFANIAKSASDGMAHSGYKA